MAPHSEFLFRVPFLVLLEWLLCLDVKQYSDWTPYGRIMQLLGKFFSLYLMFKVIFTTCFGDYSSLSSLMSAVVRHIDQEDRTSYIFLFRFLVILGMLLQMTNSSR